MMNLFTALSPYTDPYINLAIEDFLLKIIGPQEKFLFLYNNRDSVVMGRFQNPLMECRLSEMFQQGIKLVRRQSGGGCVYHDLGNLNFSFLHGERDYHKETSQTIILQALKNLNISAHRNERSDLVVSKNGIDYKFSGSAFKQKKDRSFHHGTLLIDSNLSDLNTFLKPKVSLSLSKSISSVRSRVINLVEANSRLTQSDLVAELMSEFGKCYDCKVQSLDKSVLNYSQQYLDELRSEQWIYFETPKFEFELDHGLAIRAKCNKGIILELELVSDLYPAQVLCLISQELQGKYHTQQEVLNVFESAQLFSEYNDIFTCLIESGIFYPNLQI